jgi:hypothetical protein
MGKAKLFEITLSKQVAIYFTKECVQGVLTLETENDIKLSGIFFCFSADHFTVLIPVIEVFFLVFIFT